MGCAEKFDCQERALEPVPLHFQNVGLQTQHAIAQCRVNIGMVHLFELRQCLGLITPKKGDASLQVGDVG